MKMNANRGWSVGNDSGGGFGHRLLVVTTDELGEDVGGDWLEQVLWMRQKGVGRVD